MSNIPAARNTMAVLRHLATRKGPVPASALARELALPRSSVYQLLTVMIDEGFVVHYPEDRTYGLSSLVSEIGTSALRSERLSALASPLMRSLAAEAPIPVVAHLAVLSGADVSYAARVQGTRAPTTVSAVGVKLPAHLTATGRAMLAQLTAPQVRALYPSRSSLTRRQTAGPNTLAELDRLLAATRERGWASEVGDITAEYASVGAAAFDRNGYPSAAIGLTFRTDAVEDQWDELGQATMAAARALTSRLTGRAG
ncbi:IclR family transcriptional regulator [Salinibacterium sp. NG253]|uniref:IclR family transcriptional regulator n=1 Tax=Salinibacterium sp. NG253 TaxID=2792039 RepID=UPI0018CDC41F|nr:IclR family transcriptional regulator [Salinibacterium sp. NG253]MBH0116432.1 IclR family transcriptional regulator [Salinibacterium sp. NG253]